MEQYKINKLKSRIAMTIAMILAIIMALISILPFFFMVLNSFKEKFEMLTKGVFEFPETLYLDNYKEVISGKFVTFFINSVIVLAVSLTILLLVAACASYPLSRLKFKLNAPIYALIVACMSIPVHVTLIPIFPLSKPGLSTLAIYNGVNMWNEFSFAYTLTQTAENRTLPLAVWEFKGRYSMNTPMIMAVLVLTLIPMLVLFIAAQDKLVKGMTAGAVKG